jgi:hypothetical protein
VATGAAFDATVWGVVWAVDAGDTPAGALTGVAGLPPPPPQPLRAAAVTRATAQPTTVVRTGDITRPPWSTEKT